LGVPELRLDWRQQAFGTIHLYEPEGAILKVAAYCGSALRLDEARFQEVDRGRGVASWVVLRQRAIVINDLKNSQFSRVNIVINEKVQSELAVPMIANGELVGVLNIESTRKHAFSPASTRSLWYAANGAAVAYQMAKSGLITRELLDICAMAAKDKDGAASLKKIAAVLCFALGADGCDIWRYNRSLGRFDAAGSTRDLFEPIVRPEGWSACIRERNQPVWVGDIEDEVHFSKRGGKRNNGSIFRREIAAPLPSIGGPRGSIPRRSLVSRSAS
jgi:putative methionine-R-sulfoxide reductase with GAF domain